MKKINFEDGTKISGARVNIDGTVYTVTPAVYSGATPLSSTVMNTMQDNIEDAIDQNANNIGGQDYDATSTYDVGDIVKYQEQLYICTTAITTAEAWNSNHWQATDVLSSAGGNEIAIGTSSDITGKTKIFVEESTQRLKYKDSTTGQFEDIAGDEVFIGDEEDAPDSTKIIVDTEDDSWNNIGTEVVDTLSGNEANRAPSVRAVNEVLENKVDKVDGKGLSTEDFTTAKQNKLDNIYPNYFGLPEPTKLDNTDLNNILDTGKIYFLSGANSYLNMPKGIDTTQNYSLLIYNNITNYGKIQILISDGFVSQEIYFRFWWSGWHPWRKINTTSVN